jgi:hypothetical protein
VSAQSGVAVEIDQVVDNRLTAELMTGSLDIRVKLAGSNLDRVVAARIIVKEARDDRGKGLEAPKAPDFTAREVNSGLLEISLPSPARDARAVNVKGTVELFVPSRDPAATIKIDNALAKLDAPLASKSLKSAKLTLTPLSAARYAEERKKRKITEKDIEEIRARGKAAGAAEKEIELVIGLAQAMEEMDSESLPAGSVVLSGSAKDFDRIHSIELIGKNGEPLHVGSRTSSTRGESTIMVMQPSEPAPPDTSLQLMLLTEKSRMTVPFELKNVPLP